MKNKGTSPRESAITKSIINYLEKRKRCHAVKILGSAETRNHPDVFCVLRGIPIIIEVKRPGGSYGVTGGQKFEMTRWTTAGALTFVADSVEQVKRIVGSIERTTP